MFLSVKPEGRERDGAAVATDPSLDISRAKVGSLVRERVVIGI